jgi:hypothetical protein
VPGSKSLVREEEDEEKKEIFGEERKKENRKNKISRKLCWNTILRQKLLLERKICVAVQEETPHNSLIWFRMLFS